MTARDWLIDILLLTAFLLIFYTLWLGSYPLFTPDEGRYSEIAREMIATHDYITPRVNGIAFLDKPVLHYWLQAIAIYLFGIKEWALRLFPALIGVFGCLVTYICGRQLFGRRTGLISAIVLSTTPLYFACAHYADLDLEVAVFISCSLLFFITAFNKATRMRHCLLFAAYFFAALAFLTKGLIAVAFPVMIIGCWALLLKRWHMIKSMQLVAGCLLFAAVALPWYILVQKANPGFLHYFFITQQVTRFLSTSEFNNKTPFWFYFPILLIGLFPWTMFLIETIGKAICNIWQAPNQYGTELFLLLWVIIIFTFFSIPHSKIIGYILPIFPALALLIGHTIAEKWESGFSNRLTTISFIAINALLATFLLAFSPDQWIDAASGILFYFKAIAAIFLITMAASILLLKKNNIKHFFILCICCNLSLLFLLVLSAPYLNQNSAKTLVQDLKTIISPQDEVITYFKYYQDVPLYLGQRVTVVANWHAADIAYKDNWVREFWNGIPFQNTTGWLIGEDEFWKRWYSQKRVFVFLNANYFDRFKLHLKSYFYLGKHNDILLLSNQPTVLAVKMQTVPDLT